MKPSAPRFLLIAALLFLFLPISLAQSADRIEWLQSYEPALAKSKETSLPVFVDCFADWCVWCHRLEEEVYRDPGFVRFMKEFVPLRINVEDNGEGTRLAEKYGVIGLPTLLILDPEGKLINRIGGFLGTDALIADIAMIQKLRAQETANPSNWEAIQTLAEEFLIRDMNEEAEIRLMKIVDSSEVGINAKESAHFSLAISQYYQRKLSQAIATLENYLHIHPDGKSAEDVYLLLSQIYLEMESEDKARHYLTVFLEKYPNSGNVPRAQHVLSLIKSE